MHVVQAGENPWRIMRAMLRGPQFVEPLLRLNGITDPTTIAPGTRVKLQSHWLRLLPVKAEVLRASEGVEWRAGPSQAWAPLEAGTTLNSGAWVRTPAEGECTLAFSRGTHVLVRPDTEVQLVRLEGARGAGVLAASLSVLRGSVENLVERQGSGGRFEIRTPAAVATVRGTAFRVSSTPGEMQTAVDRGAVRLGNRFGARELPAGFRAAASAEAAPSAPSPLLGAPDLGALGPRVTRFPAVLVLPPLPGARAVRARWLLQGDPLVTVSEATHERLILSGRGVPDGDHRLQVRWVDAEGFEGLEAQVPMRVHRLPDPPVYVQPIPGAVLSTEQPELEWGRSELREVRLQVSARADMSEPWVDVRLPNEGKARIPRSLGLGPWYWRLASVDPTRGIRPLGRHAEARPSTVGTQRATRSGGAPARADRPRSCDGPQCRTCVATTWNSRRWARPRPSRGSSAPTIGRSSRFRTTFGPGTTPCASAR